MELPISQIWGQDATAYAPPPQTLSALASEGALHSGIYCLLFILFILIAFNHIRHCVLPVLYGCIQFSKAIKIQEDLSVNLGKTLLFALSLFHFALIAAPFIEEQPFVIRYDLSVFVVPLVFIALLSLFFLKVFFHLLVGWLIGQSEPMKFLVFSQRDFLVSAAILSLPLSLTTLFELTPIPQPLIIWLLFVLTAAFLLFLFHSLRYFIYRRFSLFFWFLYLCAFEIAPIALLYRLAIFLY